VDVLRNRISRLADGQNGRMAPPPELPPDPAVLASFGLRGQPAPLVGGQRITWRVGDAVLKPVDTEPAVLEWQSQLLSDLAGRPDFRVAPPCRALTGELVVEGWTAWRFEPGRRRPGCWPEIIELSGVFHRALRDVARPDFLDQRTDRWAIGDRVAWAEPAPGRPAVVKHLSALAAACRPVGAASQLIHGDLTGNVLFADGLPPLVLDLSPYWRPPLFAAAIVVADALVFEGAEADLAVRLADEPGGAQYLLRALIFRAVADQLARPDAPPRPDDADPFRPAVELALRLAG
jgi:uncharacterized protein (TIGR02569 family)